MKMAAVKLTSTFLEHIFRRDATNKWRPPYQCEAGIEKTATFLRAINVDHGVTLVFGDDDDPRFFKLDEGSAVPALDIAYTSMGNGDQVIEALKQLRSKKFHSAMPLKEKQEHEDELWELVAEAFRLDYEPPVDALLMDNLDFDVTIEGEESGDGI